MRYEVWLGNTTRSFGISINYKLTTINCASAILLSMKRLAVSLLASLPLLFPLSALADAGFVKDPVWLSHAPVFADEAVLIHAGIINSTGEPLTGTLAFRDNGTTIGTLPVSLQAGEAHVYSLSWKPRAGAHDLAVELANPSQADAKRTEIISVTVKEKASSNATASAASAAGSSFLSNTTFSDSSDIQRSIESVSPAVAEVVAPAFTAIDAIRKRGSDFLSEQAADAKGKVEGISTQKAELAAQDTDEAKKEDRWLTAWQIFRTFLLYIFSALNLFLSHAGIFYPVFAFLFLFLMWKGYRRFRPARY
jgi:hypothetical protein